MTLVSVYNVNEDFDKSNDKKILEGIVNAMNRTFEKVLEHENGSVASISDGYTERIVTTEKLRRYDEASMILGKEYRSRLKDYMSRIGPLDLPRNVVDYMVESPKDTMNIINELPDGLRGIRTDDFIGYLRKYEQEGNKNWYDSELSGTGVV